MKTLTMLAAAVLVAAFGSAAVAGQSAGGSTAFDFLRFDANARPVGMAGAYTALATDANALLYNPAGLAGVEANEATFMHNQYVEGITQEYVSYASKQGWGVNFNYLSWGNIGRTTRSQPDGTGTTFGLNDLAIGGGYGRKLGMLSAGVGFKLLREQIDNVTGTGLALDAGVMALVPEIKGLQVGAALRNLGPDVKFQRAKEKLPTELRLGAAYSCAAFGAAHTGTLDLGKDRMDTLQVAMGLESVIGKVIAVRFGYTTRNDAGIGITGGVGWIWNNARVDYAVVPFDTLGVAHRVSLSYRWGPVEGTEKIVTPAAPKAAAPAPVPAPAPTSQKAR